jgi:N-methylhydantoinase B
MLFFNSGGMGARPSKDGLSSTAFPSGVHGTPAEIVEARSPLFFVRRELRPDSGGAGEFRGGLGHWLEVKGLGAGGAYRFSPFFDRTLYPARGYAGGAAGARGAYALEGAATAETPGGAAGGGGAPADGATPGPGRPNPKQTVWVAPQTAIVMGLPGGGGFGDPLARDPARVAEDVRDGYVTAARAVADYGVVLDGAGGVDLPATAALRAGRREAAGGGAGTAPGLGGAAGDGVDQDGEQDA